MQLATEGVDIAGRQDSRVNIGAIGGSFRRQTEGVPAHRVEDIVALHPPHTGDDIRGGVPFRVTNMQPVAGGIGEHVQNVIFRFLRQLSAGWCTKNSMIGPSLLPLGFDHVGRVVV